MRRERERMQNWKECFDRVNLPLNPDSGLASFTSSISTSTVGSTSSACFERNNHESRCHQHTLQFWIWFQVRTIIILWIKNRLLFRSWGLKRQKHSTDCIVCKVSDSCLYLRLEFGANFRGKDKDLASSVTIHSVCNLWAQHHDRKTREQAIKNQLRDERTTRARVQRSFYSHLLLLLSSSWLYFVITHCFSITSSSFSSDVTVRSKKKQMILSILEADMKVYHVICIHLSWIFIIFFFASC